MLDKFTVVITLAIALGTLLVSRSAAQPRISFTFDDGVTADRPGYRFEEWNQMLLDKLEEADVTAIFFVTGANKQDEKGAYLLRSWDERGHGIANHTYSHVNYSSPQVTFTDFFLEFMRTDSIIRVCQNFVPLFRFPYLKEGETPEKVQRMRTALRENGYKNGYVTIDASDWYIDSRLLRRLTKNPDTSIDRFRDFYLEHLLQRANFYEHLSYSLTGRHINHTLLLHHNLASALFIDDLVARFRKEGWEIISALDAYSDPIFDRQPEHAGESLVWALAADSGAYDDQLRYPAESGKYEENRMNELGL